MEQIAQALNDRKTETKTSAVLARGVVELTVFVKDRVKFFVGAFCT